tara:strand:- start:84 stop:419 length:336 start_codon:yes stop_codon:yes gene_type:complete
LYTDDDDDEDEYVLEEEASTALEEEASTALKWQATTSAPNIAEPGGRNSRRGFNPIAPLSSHSLRCHTGDWRLYVSGTDLEWGVLEPQNPNTIRARHLESRLILFQSVGFQ